MDADVKAIRRAGIRIGVSTHDHAELEKGLAVDPDYVALGPICPTAAQADAVGAAGHGAARANGRRLIGDRPLVAIGGLTLERALLCLAAGAGHRAPSSATSSITAIRSPRPRHGSPRRRR